MEAVMLRVEQAIMASCGTSFLPARAVRTAVAAVAIAMIAPRLIAAERIDTAIVAAIIAEAQDHSEAAEIFYELTDELGPRLSGSPS
jgi:hypothetical protein